MPVKTSVTTKLHRPATMDHLRKKEPLERVVEIALSDSAFQLVQELELKIATTSDEVAVKKLKKELELANKELDDSTVELRFKSLGRKAYEALLAEHPGEEDEDDPSKNQMWNAETFPKALVQASLIEPKLTVEEVDTLWDEWNGNEVTALFYAALDVNTSSRLVK